MTWLISFFTGLINIFVTLWKSKASRLETVAREAAENEVKLQEQVAINEDVKKADSAKRDLDRRLADDPSSLWDDDGFKIGS